MPPVPPPKLPAARAVVPKAPAARRPAPTVPPPALRVSGPASAAAQPQRPVRPVPSVSAPVAYRAVTVNGRRRIEAHLPGRAQPVGHVDVALREGHAEILNLNVKPEFRRQAIGAQLVRQSVQLARAQSAASIHLTARPSPGGAPAAALVAMYRKAGFQPNGMSPAGLRMALPGTVQRSARPVVPPPALRPQQPIRPIPAAGRGAVQRTTPNFRAAVIQRAEERHNTAYTYFLTRPTSQLTGTPQGPHTVAHGIVSHGVEQYLAQGDPWEQLEELFDNQVPDPDTVAAIIQSELPAKAQSSTKVKAQVARYLDDYMITHGNVMAAFDDPDEYDFDEVAGAVRALMEMHPYQTYAWKSGKPASKRSTKGKGEAKHLKEFRGGNKKSLAGLVDISRARFVEMGQFLDFVRLRLSLVASDTDIDAILA